MKQQVQNAPTNNAWQRQMLTKQLPIGLERLVQRLVDVSGRNLDAGLFAHIPHRIIHAKMFENADTRPPHSLFVVQEGISLLVKDASEKKRQIYDYCISGDIVNLHSLSTLVDDDICVYEDTTLIVIELTAIDELQRHNPAFASALLIESIVQARRNIDWVVNIGGRNATASMANFFKTFVDRTATIGVSPYRPQNFPFNQKQLAEALGLSLVHINKTYRCLNKLGVVQVKDRLLTVIDYDLLRTIASEAAYIDDIEQF